MPNLSDKSHVGTNGPAAAGYTANKPAAKPAAKVGTMDKGKVVKYAVGAVVGAGICGGVVYAATSDKKTAGWAALGGAIAMTFGMPIAEYLDTATMKLFAAPAK